MLPLPLPSPNSDQDRATCKLSMVPPCGPVAAGGHNGLAHAEPILTDEARRLLLSGVYNSRVLDSLDWLMDEAANRGLQFMMTLTQQWSAYGGIPQYVRYENGIATIPRHKRPQKLPIQAAEIICNVIVMPQATDRCCCLSVLISHEYLTADCRSPAHW